MKARLVFKGGTGSGNYGHSGRPGKVGGSGGGSGGSGGGRSSNFTRRDAVTAVNALEWQATQRARKAARVTGGNAMNNSRTAKTSAIIDDIEADPYSLVKNSVAVIGALEAYTIGVRHTAGALSRIKRLIEDVEDAAV